MAAAQDGTASARTQADVLAETLSRGPAMACLLREVLAHALTPRHSAGSLPAGMVALVLHELHLRLGLPVGDDPRHRVPLSNGSPATRSSLATIQRGRKIRGQAVLRRPYQAASDHRDLVALALCCSWWLIAAEI